MVGDGRATAPTSRFGYPLCDYTWRAILRGSGSESEGSGSESESESEGAGGRGGGELERIFDGGGLRAAAAPRRGAGPAGGNP